MININQLFETFPGLRKLGDLFLKFVVLTTAITTENIFVDLMYRDTRGLLCP